MFKYSAITEKIKLSSDSWLPKNSVGYLLLIKCNSLTITENWIGQHGAGGNNS